MRDQSNHPDEAAAPMSQPHSLSTLLRILDEADAIRDRQEAQAVATREHLIQVAQQLGSDHSMETLTQAVNACVKSEQTVTVPSNEMSVTDFSFGWCRPGSEQERLVQERQADAEPWNDSHAIQVAFVITKVLFVPLAVGMGLMLAGVHAGGQVNAWMGWNANTHFYLAGICPTAGLLGGRWQVALSRAGGGVSRSDWSSVGCCGRRLVCAGG